MGKIVKLKNKKTGVKVYPVTATSAVVDANTGERLNDTLMNKVEEAPVDGNQYVRINGTWGIAQMATSTKEKCIITLASNQGEGDAASLYGATVKVTDVDSAEVYHNGVWDGTEIALEFAPGVKYKVEVGAVTDYATPESKTLTALDFNVRNLVMTYNTEEVSVMLTSDNGTSVAGQIVTINGVQKTFDGTNAVVQKVAYGVEYTVSVNEKVGYITPKEKTYTSSSFNRNVEIVYTEEVLGVYIEATDGTLILPENWASSGKTANGVFIGTEQCSFVVALEDANNSEGVAWGIDQLVNDIPSHSDFSGVGVDLDGENYTDIIIKELGEGNAPAAESCKSYIFPNGNKGYLGGGGEWYALKDNILDFRTAIGKCGSGLDSSRKYWTCSQQNRGTAFAFNTSLNTIGDISKAGLLPVRAFTKRKRS